MEFTSEIYWNVGHGIWTLLPMYLLANAAIGVVVWGTRQRIQTYKLGLPLNRRDQPVKRGFLMMRKILLQEKVTGVWPGILHGLFFWGFGLLVIGTAHIVLQAVFTDLFFDLKFLKGTFYKIFSITLDLAGLICLGMLAALFIRRYILRPRGLETGWDDATMHT